MKYEVYKDSAGEWRWRAVAKNNKIVADSAEGYSTKGNARRALRKFRSQAYYADIE